MKSYRKKKVQEMRPFVPGESLNGISISSEETPELGGMIAVSSTNPADIWYIPKEFFNENYEEVKTSDMDFGDALKMLKTGNFVVRKGWNGHGIHLGYHVPGKHAMMTTPYIYIDTSGLHTKNPDAPKVIVPWLPSQTDMLANDWQVI